MKKIYAGGKPVDRTTQFFKEMENHGASGGKALYKRKNRLYQWDTLHGEWEEYDLHGCHRGA